MASGKHEYMPGHKPSQVRHHEWRTAENSAAYLLPKLKSMAADKPDLKLLDIGTGPGTLAASLAKYMPEGHVTGSDFSESIIDRARELATSAGVNNISFQVANAYELPFEDGSFDITHCHQMLCHLETPVKALKEMIRVTKPGGVVAARESDLKMWCHWPELPYLNMFHETLLATHSAGGDWIDGGRRLVSWAMEAGMSRESITQSYDMWCYDTPYDREEFGASVADRCRDGGMRKRGVEMGVEESEFDKMAEAWEEWIKATDGTLGIMNGEILIQK